MTKQFHLFDDQSTSLKPREQSLILDQAGLSRWKAQIYQYQKNIRTLPPPQQTNLFLDINPQPKHWDAEQIDPFDLPEQTMRLASLPQSKYAGDRACLYFVIDHVLPILLYVGETKRTVKERWQNLHDCKDYVANYISLNRQYGLDVAVSKSLITSVPTQRSQRLQLERDLILRWRSPFNKECWHYWGQPFKKI